MSLDVHSLPHTTLEPLCADEPELFFPPGNDWGEGVNLRDRIDAAKATCARCPLLVPLRSVGADRGRPVRHHRRHVARGASS